MKCRAKNSRNRPCGNDAVEGEIYCQAHLKRRSRWYQKIVRPAFVAPLLVALLGIAADLLGIWSFRGDWFNKTKLLAGIEFIEGGIEFNSDCDVGICNKETAGVSDHDDFEAVIHFVLGPEAGDCLALGFSLLNQTDALVKNVRAQVSLSGDGDMALEFCNDFGAVYNSIYPNVKMARQFAKVNGVSVASYTIDEIAPQNAHFFTVPIRNSPNLWLVRENRNVRLEGKPTKIRVTHSAENSELGDINAYVYQSVMSDKAQGIVDHTLLIGYHTKFTEAVFSDASPKIVNHIKSWLSDRPSYTEFLIGSYVSSLPTDGADSYSVPTEPILKQVVTARKDGDLIGTMDEGEYIQFKTQMCADVVQDVEGASYDCTQKPFVPTKVEQ